MTDTRNGPTVESKEVNQPITLPQEPNRLCMDAIADAWSKTHGQPAQVFETQIAHELHMEGASHTDLNTAYMGKVKTEEIRRKGEVEGNKIFSKAEQTLSCHD